MNYQFLKGTDLLCDNLILQPLPVSLKTLGYCMQQCFATLFHRPSNQSLDQLQNPRRLFPSEEIRFTKSRRHGIDNHKGVSGLIMGHKSSYLNGNKDVHELGDTVALCSTCRLGFLPLLLAIQGRENALLIPLGELDRFVDIARKKGQMRLC